MDILESKLTVDHKGCKQLSILDLACGNLRFENWLSSVLNEYDMPRISPAFYAVDNCDRLLMNGLSPSDTLAYQNLDLVGALLSSTNINQQLKAPLCDISVAFGFFHHIPTQQHRETLLEALINHTKPGGYVIVSFWQFFKHPVLRKKAQASHLQALKKFDLPKLDDGDFLLGWKDMPDQFRYCHSFSDKEIENLIEPFSSKARQIASFVADGRTNDLNTYVILQTR